MKATPGHSDAGTEASEKMPGPSIFNFVLRGASGFAVVSVAAFSVWALGGRWFRGYGGEGAMYAAIAGVFVVLSGVLLHPLVLGRNRFFRFYAVFSPAFLAYAVVWSGFWFWLKFGWGEWLGAAAGSLVFVAVCAWSFGHWRRFAMVVAVFFILHTAGYFAGGHSMAWLMAASRQPPVPWLDAPSLVTLAKLSWGLFYGIGLGSGLGFVFGSLQTSGPTPALQPKALDLK